MAKRTFLMDIDLNKNQLLNATIQNLSTAPSSPNNGQLYYNTASNLLQIYNGATWTNLGLNLSQLGGEPSITSGTALQYWRGDKTFQTLNSAAVPELTNLYFTNARVNSQVQTYTGDVTLTGTAFGLATVNSNVGSFGSSTTIPSFTVNSKGLITAAAATAIATLNQNTTGSAGSLLNSHLIFGQSFNGTADVSGVAATGGVTITNGAKSIHLTVDSTTGNLLIDGNVNSTGDIVAYGTGGLTGSTGLVTTVYNYANLLAATDASYLDSDLTSTMNANATYQLRKRINTLESGASTSITVTGAGNAVTSISKAGNVITANFGSTFLTNNQAITVTGDASGYGTNAITLTLPTVNTNVGAYGSSTAIPTFTVNAKGLITAAGTSAVIAPAGTLSGTVLNSTVVSSSLTSVGTIATGTWNGSVILGQFGGTGINNAGKTITLGGNLTTSGAFSTTINVTAATSVSLPTSGTLYGTAAGSMTSAQLLSSLADGTGTGSAVFGTSPTFSNSLLTNSTSLNVFNTIATTVNAFGAATTLSIGAATGNSTINNNLVVTGNLVVNGTTETINSTTISIADKNIFLGTVATPTDVTANGGGVTLYGSTNKTLNWVSSTPAWTSSENFDLAAGKTYKIATNDVLSISGSNLTLGGSNGLILNTTNKTITQGIWNGSVIGVAYGGTGYNSGVITRKVTGTVTGGTTTFSVVHGFTSGIVAQLFETVSGSVVECEIVTAVAGTTIFNFNVAPTSGYYSYTIVG